MIRLMLLAVPLTLGLLAATSAEEAKEQKLTVTSYTGHFEKNNSGLTGEKSFLVLPTQAAFEKVFGTVPPLMGANKFNRLPAGVFEKDAVVAVITRANAVTEYSDVSVTLEGKKLTVSYKARTGPAGTAQFASPLILGLPKEKFNEVVFIENGKKVGEAK